MAQNYKLISISPNIIPKKCSLIFSDYSMKLLLPPSLLYSFTP